MEVCSTLGRQIGRVPHHPNVASAFRTSAKVRLSRLDKCQIVILTSADTSLRLVLLQSLISAFCGFMALASVLRAFNASLRANYVKDFHCRYTGATQASGGGEAQRSMDS